MKINLLRAWDTLRSSFWFVPTLLMLVAVGLAVGALALDERLESDDLRGRWWIYAGGADGARAVLSAVAGSVITVAGTVFSITIAALTLASSQFGPRILRTFMRDKGNQIVLGVFLATFLYCLLVLRTVRGDSDSLDALVPHIAVTGGVVLAVMSLGVLIYFIHHAAASIQAAHIIDAISRDLTRAVERLFPDRLGHENAAKDDANNGENALPDGFERDARPVPLPDKKGSSGGYVLAVDGDAVLGIACERDLFVHVDRRPGDFVEPGGSLARVWPPSRAGDDAVARQIAHAFLLGPQRTDAQDLLFVLNQLVEIAVRALSPGINDPFTAVQCLDRLGAGLGRLATRRPPAPLRRDSDDVPRVWAAPVSFAQAADAAFDQIRQNSSAVPAVAIRLLETIAGVAEHACTEEQRATLRRHADLVLQACRDGFKQEADRAVAEARHARALAVLEERTEQTAA